MQCNITTGIDLLEYTSKFGAPTGKKWTSFINTVESVEQNNSNCVIPGKNIVVENNAVDDLKNMSASEILHAVYNIQQENDFADNCWCFVSFVAGIFVGRLSAKIFPF